MTVRKFLPLMFAALAACGDSVPGVSDVQDALVRYDKDAPIMFGGDVPTVKDAQCTPFGEDAYNCALTVSAAAPGGSDETMQVRMTKLNGQWRAQVTSLF